MGTRSVNVTGPVQFLIQHLESLDTLLGRGVCPEKAREYGRVLLSKGISYPHTGIGRVTVIVGSG